MQVEGVKPDAVAAKMNAATAAVPTIIERREICGIAGA
jgi:hypothetical protein